MTQPKPNFLIIGSPRSGSTWLWQNLRSHPDVFMPERKEPNYFSSGAYATTPFERYLALFHDAGDAKAVGEASVRYLSNPDAPQRVFDRLGPDVKLIAILRNPVDRAIAQWARDVSRGADRTKGIFCAEMGKYLHDGLYCLHLDRWRRLFAEENFRILITEIDTRIAGVALDGVCVTLGLIDEVFDSTHHWPNSRTRINPGALRDHRDSLVTGREREGLVNYYRDDVRRLEASLDRDIFWEDFR